MTDFEKVFLDIRSMHILKEVACGSVLTLHETDARLLLSLGFISKYALSKTEDEYVVSDDGLLYVEFLQSRETAVKEKEKRERFRVWFGIILSNLIALASLIASVLK